MTADRITALFGTFLRILIGTFGVRRRRRRPYVAGCLFRAVGVMCQALHGHDRRWLLNEKGMVVAAGALTSAPPGFAIAAQSLLGSVGADQAHLQRTVTEAKRLITAVRVSIGTGASPNLPD